MHELELQEHSKLAHALANRFGDWSAISALVAPAGVPVGEIHTSAEVWLTWTDVLRVAAAQPGDVFRQLLDHLEREIPDDAVRTAIRAFRRARSLTSIVDECQLLNEQLELVTRRAPGAQTLTLIETALISLIMIARAARDRTRQGVPGGPSDPDLNTAEAELLATAASDAYDALQMLKERLDLERAAPRLRRGQLYVDQLAARLELKDQLITRRRELVEALEPVAAFRLGLTERT